MDNILESSIKSSRIILGMSSPSYINIKYPVFVDSYYPVACAVFKKFHRV